MCFATDRKRSSPSAPCTGRKYQLVECPQLKRVFVKVWVDPAISQIPGEPDGGHETGLAAAVFAHEQGQRRERDLMTARKATEVFEDELFHTAMLPVRCEPWTALLKETTPCIANVNGDAIADIRDALFIRRFAAGLLAP